MSPSFGVHVRRARSSGDETSNPAFERTATACFAHFRRQVMRDVSSLSPARRSNIKV